MPAVIIVSQGWARKPGGVVDWLNSAFYHFFPPATEFGTFQFTLLATGNYLFDHLAAERYITNEDRQALIAAARHQP